MHVLQAYLHFKTRCRGRNINFSRHIIHAPPYEDGMLDEARELITWMFHFPRVIAKIMPGPFDFTRLTPISLRLSPLDICYFHLEIHKNPCFMILLSTHIRYFHFCKWKICLCRYFCVFSQICLDLSVALGNKVQR